MSEHPGLTSIEAKRRLETIGPNEISTSRFANRLRELGKLFLDPMGLMLLGLAGLYAALGDHSDALVLLLAWVPVTAVDVVLELRASAALKALKAHLHPIAKVLRDGAIREVPIREIVPGDVVAFEEGQMLPADGRVLEARNLSLNESALTGESVPIEKGEGQEFLGGTQILTGHGLGLVEKTGIKTRFGHIAGMLESAEATSSPLKQKVDRLVRRVLWGAGLLAAVLFVLEHFRTGQFVPSLIVALTFGMSAVPEEFPLVFTLYLSLGAWRLAKHRVLVKSLPSVEALGSVDVLCTDKTGTLTEGRFQLTEAHKLGGADERTTWESALLACEPQPVDSMELAIRVRGSDYAETLAGWTLVWDYPFEKRGKHMTHVWRRSDSATYRTVMKGAVEGVLEHCKASPAERSEVERLVKEYAAQGKRILGLAMREGAGTGDRDCDERDLTFIAILVFSDPIRPSVSQAIRECQEAGIEIKMLTGDHPITAHFVADQAGIEHSHDSFITGEDLEKMGVEQRRAAYLKGAIFSRVLPEQKFEMIKELRSAGRIVAMTGDGINDAPALRLADIGISMGQSAADVARSAAQIVLLKNDFSGIVAAMLEGRKILSNLRRSFSYLTSFHVPVILLALVPPFLGWPALLLPIHIIILELVVHPVSAVVFENLPADGAGSKGILDQEKILTSLFSGVLVSLGALVCYEHLFKTGSINVARATAFSAILAGNLAFIVSEVWPELNLRFAITAIALLACIGVIARVPLAPLHFSPTDFIGSALAIGLGALGLLPRLFPVVRLVFGPKCATPRRRGDNRER